MRYFPLVLHAKSFLPCCLEGIELYWNPWDIEPPDARSLSRPMAFGSRRWGQSSHGNICSMLRRYFLTSLW